MQGPPCDRLDYDGANKLSLTLIDSKENESKVYEMLACMLKDRSHYFHALLSSGFAESKSRHVTIDDVDIAAFDEALSYLQNPIQVRTMTIRNAIKVFPIYDRFDIPAGLDICNRLFEEFVVDLERSWDDGLFLSVEGQLDMAIEISLSCSRRQLGCLDMWLDFFTCILCDVDVERLILSELQIEALVPLIRDYPDKLMPPGLSHVDNLETLEPRVIARMIYREYQSIFAKKALYSNRELVLESKAADMTLRIVYDPNGNILNGPSCSSADSKDFENYHSNKTKNFVHEIASKDSTFCQLIIHIHHEEFGSLNLEFEHTHFDESMFVLPYSEWRFLESDSTHKGCPRDFQLTLKYI